MLRGFKSGLRKISFLYAQTGNKNVAHKNRKNPDKIRVFLWLYLFCSLLMAERGVRTLVRVSANRFPVVFAERIFSDYVRTCCRFIDREYPSAAMLFCIKNTNHLRVERNVTVHANSNNTPSYLFELILEQYTFYVFLPRIVRCFAGLRFYLEDTSFV